MKKKKNIGPPVFQNLEKGLAGIMRRYLWNQKIKANLD